MAPSPVVGERRPEARGIGAPQVPEQVVPASSPPTPPPSHTGRVTLPPAAGEGSRVTHTGGSSLLRARAPPTHTPGPRDAGRLLPCALPRESVSGNFSRRHVLVAFTTTTTTKNILYYTILYYTILYYTILYYTIPYYTILYYTILYYTIVYYTILYYSILYYTILYYTILYYTILYYTILYYTILYYTILYYTILYYTILYYTILYYTILYYTILNSGVPPGESEVLPRRGPRAQGTPPGFFGHAGRRSRRQPPPRMGGCTQ